MKRRTWLILATVAGMAVTGALAVASAPPDTHIGYMWPTGLATGALLLSRRPRGGLVLAAVFGLAIASYLPGDQPLSVAVAYAAVICVEAWVVDRMVPRREDGWAWLLRTSDVSHYIAACTTGAAVGGLGYLVVSAASGYGTPWEVGLAAFATHLASQFIVVPFFLRMPHRVLQHAHSERVSRWVLTLGVAVVALVPRNMPSLAFLLLPLLGWTSVRATMRETQLLVLAVAGVASTASSLGYGPFSRLDSRLMASPELAEMRLQAFLVACVLVTIPLALAVRQEREALRTASTERTRNDNLIASTHGLVLIGTDDLGRINLFNPGAERVLGYSAEEVTGRSPEMFHSAAEITRLAEVLDCKPQFFDVVAHYLARPEPTPMDWEFVCKDGTRRILAFVLTPIQADDGHVLGFLASGDDMTERVRTQHSLEAGLAKALAAESDAVRRLAAVDRAKDSFVSAVSHELRTPITNLVGYLELLRDGSYGDLNEEQERALGRIQLNSNRLLTLIDDVLTLARIEEPHLIPSAHRPVDLVTLVGAAGDELAGLGADRGLRIRVDLPGEPITVIGDAGQLGRLLANLVDNAAKFTPPGGAVTLRVSRDEGSARVDVIDTGVGIPSDEQGRVFGRFFRSTTAEEQAVPGTGLGLFIAKAIAEAHGADIYFRSTLGKGTAFSVRLPLNQAPAVAPES